LNYFCLKGELILNLGESIDELSDPISLADTLESTGRLQDHGKLITFACACCRLIYDKIPETAQKSLVLAEEFVKGLASTNQLLDERVRLWRFLGKESCDFSSARVNAVRAVICCLYADTPPEEAYNSVLSLMEFCNDVEQHRSQQCALMHQIF